MTRRGKPETVSVALTKGHVETLRALSARLAGVIDDPRTPPYSLASLCRLLADLSREVDDLDAEATAADSKRDTLITPDGVWVLGNI